jgi:hypothetical protein
LSETKKQKSFHAVDQQEGRHLEMQLQAIEDRRQRTIDLLQKMRLDQPDFDFDELDQVSTSIKLFPLFPVKWCYVLWSERHLIDKQTCQPIYC